MDLPPASRLADLQSHAAALVVSAGRAIGAAARHVRENVPRSRSRVRGRAPDVWRSVKIPSWAIARWRAPARVRAVASCTGPAVASIVERSGILTVSRMSKNRVPLGRRSSKPAGSGCTRAVSPAHESPTPARVDGLALSDRVLSVDDREVPAVPAEDHVGGAVACPDEIGLVAAGEPVGLGPTVDEVLAGSAVLGVHAGLARQRVALPAAEDDLDVVGDVVVLVALPSSARPLNVTDTGLVRSS